MPKKSRQLAAIMFTDIVGYTKLMQGSEKHALKIRNKHRRVFEASNNKYKGNIIQYYGDGTLSIFNSAVDAVKCAIAIQSGLRKPPVVPLRIGIHLGEIMLIEDDIIGDSVNIASRIESLGVEGGILISKKVVDEIKNQEGLSCLYMGSFHFKNDLSKRDVFSLSTPGIIVPAPEQLEGKLEKHVKKKEISSIAILPFNNFTGDPGQNYIADGLHDSLITSLSQISTLRVISRTSTLPFRGTTTSIPAIAEALKVDAIVEASVSKLSSKVHLNIQLIRAFPKEDHLWAKVYARDIKDIFALFGEITQSIAKQINIELTKEINHNLSNSSTINPSAYRAYLRGMFHWEKLSAKDFELAVGYFNKSIAIDNRFAPSYAAIANTILGQVQMGLTSPIDSIPKIYEFNQKALAIDPDFADANYLNALLCMAVEWNWNKSENAFKNAINSNPNFSLAHAYYAHLLMEQKRFDEALQEVTIALKVDPNNPLVQSLSGIVYFHYGNIQKAHKLGTSSFRIDPNNILTLRLLEISNYNLGHFKQAFEYQKRILKDEPSSLEALEKGFAVKDYNYAMELMAQNKEALSEQQFVQPVWIAYAYIRAKKKEEALRWLEKGYQMHDQDMPYAFLVKEFDPIRNDPRFIGLAKKMNLPV